MSAHYAAYDDFVGTMMKRFAFYRPAAHVCALLAFDFLTVWKLNWYSCIAVALNIIYYAEFATNCCFLFLVLRQGKPVSHESRMLLKCLDLETPEHIDHRSLPILKRMFLLTLVQLLILIPLSYEMFRVHAFNGTAVQVSSLSFAAVVVICAWVICSRASNAVESIFIFSIAVVANYDTLVFSHPIISVGLASIAYLQYFYLWWLTTRHYLIKSIQLSSMQIYSVLFFQLSLLSIVSFFLINVDPFVRPMLSTFSIFGVRLSQHEAANAFLFCFIHGFSAGWMCAEMGENVLWAQTAGYDLSFRKRKGIFPIEYSWLLGPLLPSTNV